MPIICAAVRSTRLLRFIDYAATQRAVHMNRCHLSEKTRHLPSHQSAHIRETRGARASDARRRSPHRRLARVHRHPPGARTELPTTSLRATTTRRQNFPRAARPRDLDLARDGTTSASRRPSGRVARIAASSRFLAIVRVVASVPGAIPGAAPAAPRRTARGSSTVENTIRTRRGAPRPDVAR